MGGAGQEMISSLIPSDNTGTIIFRSFPFICASNFDCRCGFPVQRSARRFTLRQRRPRRAHRALPQNPLKIESPLKRIDHLLWSFMEQPSAVSLARKTSNK